MYFSRLKKRRRGQIRAVDFIVSLFLFLLMLTQLILIIINVQTDVTGSGIGNITSEELDIFGRQLLEQKGDPFWGYQKNLPNSFGLADSLSTTPLTLSAAKISRLITGTSFLISESTGYEMHNYNSLKEMIKLDARYEFQIGFFPVLKVSVTSSIINITANIVEATVTNFQNTPIPDVQLYFYSLDLTNGEAILEEIALTNSTGGASKEYLIPSFGIPDSDHISVVIAKKSAMWGINWSYAKTGLPSSKVLAGSESNTTIWGGGINSSSILISDKIKTTNTIDNHFLTILYEKSSSSFSNQTINLGTSSESNKTISVPTNGLVFFFSIVREDDSYKVGIGSYPAILDQNSDTGIFYQVFGETDPSENLKARLSKIYPIVVRGTLMQCQVTLWSF